MKKILVIMLAILLWSVPVFSADQAGYYVQREVVYSATGNAAAIDMKGSIINNYGQADDAVISLPAIAKGYQFSVVLGTTVAKYYRIDPNASDSIYLDGVTTGDGKYVGVASASAGNALSCVAFQTGASAYDWYCSTVSGPWLAE